jgi:hypothetical protein
MSRSRAGKTSPPSFFASASCPGPGIDLSSRASYITHSADRIVRTPDGGGDELLFRQNP